MMNNITSNGEICSNNNNHNPSMVSFVGLECNNQKQYGEWETNNTTTHSHTHTHPTHNNNANPSSFINPTTNNIFDHHHNFNYNSHPSSSHPSNFTSNFIPFSQFPDYPSSNFFKKQQEQQHGVLDGGLYYNGSTSSDRGIGLNLGHRTYFSSRESTMMDRLIRRPRGFYLETQIPRCQAEGCMIDLTNAKHYHRRHKVCEFHSKATKVVAGGLEQRFCQQCSRFHVLAEFDEAKRSCRKRLADHNRRRRKPHQPGPSDSLPAAKTSENVLQVGSSSSSVSRSEEVVQETSLSSSTLSLMISKCTTNNEPVRTSTSTGKDTVNMTHFMTSSSSNCGPSHHPHPPPSALSLAGHHELIRSCNSTSTTTDHHDQSQPFITTTTQDSTSSTLFIHRDMSTTTSTVSSPYHHNLFFSNVNHDSDDHHQALQSTGDGDGSSVDRNQLHHQEDLHNLLHLRQAMFDVEFV